MESPTDVFEDRLTSFTNWPHGMLLRPQVMAAAGFFHSNWDTDEVTCFHCNIAIDRWNPQADPFQQHLLLSPACTFINKTFMSTLEERLASFHTWPLQVKPMPVTMAAAGFFHSNKRSDTVTCFCCTLQMEDWKKDDDPIRRHVQAAAVGRECAWLSRIVGVPEQVVKPVPKRAAPLWDHRQVPRKCGDCRKVFSSGNQFHKHRREARPLLRREGHQPGRGVGKRRGAVPQRKVARAGRRPAQNPLGAVMLGRHRVSKSTRKVRMPARRRNTDLFEDED